MSRQGLMDDSGYIGFEECSKYESCTEDAYNDGYEKGATDMENAKQIIIDALLKQLEVVRADAIKEVLKVADCSHTDCWDCAFADADLCKLQMLYKDWNS